MVHIFEVNGLLITRGSPPDFAYHLDPLLRAIIIRKRNILYHLVFITRLHYHYPSWGQSARQSLTTKTKNKLRFSGDMSLFRKSVIIGRPMLFSSLLFSLIELCSRNSNVDRGYIFHSISFAINCKICLIPFYLFIYFFFFGGGEWRKKPIKAVWNDTKFSIHFNLIDYLCVASYAPRWL